MDIHYNIGSKIVVKTVIFAKSLFKHKKLGCDLSLNNF